MISETALQEFKKLWREEFNEDVTDEQALEVGTNLLNLFNHIYRPVKKSWLDELDSAASEGKKL